MSKVSESVVDTDAPGVDLRRLQLGNYHVFRDPLSGQDYFNDHAADFNMKILGELVHRFKKAGEWVGPPAVVFERRENDNVVSDFSLEALDERRFVKSALGVAAGQHHILAACLANVPIKTHCVLCPVSCSPHAEPVVYFEHAVKRGEVSRTVDGVTVEPRGLRAYRTLFDVADRKELGFGYCDNEKIRERATRTGRDVLARVDAVFADEAKCESVGIDRMSDQALSDFCRAVLVHESPAGEIPKGEVLRKQMLDTEHEPGRYRIRVEGSSRSRGVLSFDGQQNKGFVEWVQGYGDPAWVATWGSHDWNGYRFDTLEDASRAAWLVDGELLCGVKRFDRVEIVDDLNGQRVCEPVVVPAYRVEAKTLVSGPGERDRWEGGYIRLGFSSGDQDGEPAPKIEWLPDGAVDECSVFHDDVVARHFAGCALFAREELGLRGSTTIEVNRHDGRGWVPDVGACNGLAPSQDGVEGVTESLERILPDESFKLSKYRFSQSRLANELTDVLNDQDFSKAVRAAPVVSPSKGDMVLGMY